MAAILGVGALIVGLIALCIGLFILGIYLLFVGITDSVYRHITFWSILDIILGFMLIGGGGTVLRSRKKN